MGEASSHNGGIPGSAKVVMLLQAVVIGFLSFWAIEEYQNNLYFQQYVNSTIQANIVAISLGVAFMLVLGAGAFARTRRGTIKQEQPLSFEPDLSGGEPRLAAQPAAQQVANDYEAARKPAQTLSSATGKDSGQMPILERVELGAAAGDRPSSWRFPMEERAETKPSPVDRPVFQRPPPFPDRVAPIRDSGYRPSSPPSPGFPGPVAGRIQTGGPIPRPSTVVTGVIGQGSRERPFPQKPPVGLGSMGTGQGPELRPVPQKWAPGKPQNTTVGPMDRPFPINPPSAPVLPEPGRPVFGRPVAQNPQTVLGRVGPVQAAVNKLPSQGSLSGLGRVEPVQAVADKLAGVKPAQDQKQKAQGQDVLPGLSDKQLGLVRGETGPVPGLLEKRPGQKPASASKRDEELQDYEKK